MLCSDMLLDVYVLNYSTVSVIDTYKVMFCVSPPFTRT